MLTTELTSEEISHLLSLSESEQEEFWSAIPESDFDSVIRQIASGGQSGSGADYAAARSARNAEIINAKTAASQEIGPLPDIVNPQRRERCAADNLLFAETYFKPTFYLPWAPYQRAMMDRFQEVIFSGGKEAHAVRRGGLKSTCARVATIWAAVNGHRKFPVLIGATDDKANEHRENFFSLLASSTTLLDDYPELTPLLLKLRQPKRQFRLNGRPLTLSHKDERGRIVFPDIHDAPSCQCHIAPYSVNSTDVSGLSYVDRFGVTIRPDLLAFDDVQTPQTALSPSQTEQLEDRITKTFGGLAGLGQKMAQIMVCTVREPDDLTIRFLNRDRHKDWHGKVYPSVLRMPDKMDLWDSYAAKLGQGATPDEGKKLAQEFYAANRSAMDAGGEIAWEHDKLPEELSALQSLMTIRALDPEFFRKEIQQEGDAPVNTSGLKLDTQTLMNRLSHIPRGSMPESSSYLTAFIDSSDQVLWGMVLSVNSDFSGSIVDYRTWPDQGRPIFYKSDLVRTIGQELPGKSWEEAFVHAHNQFEAELFADFPDLDLMLKDWSDGGQMPLIRSQIQASKERSRMRPSKGFAIAAGRKPIHLWGDPVRDKSGTGWIERRSDTPTHVQFDANLMKSFASRRLLTAVGAPSAIVLPGTEERTNRLLTEHFTAETPKEKAIDGAKSIIWAQNVGRDNDWWDTFVGCLVGASVMGAKLNGDSGTKKEIRAFALPGGSRRG